MTCTKEELKQRIETTPVAKNGRMLFSPELRRDISAYAKERKAATGCSGRSVAEELGLNGWTMMRWSQNERPAKTGASFVEVSPKKRVRPKEAVAMVTSTFEVTCPSGYEVRVPADFEAGALRELLAALEGR